MEKFLKNKKLNSPEECIENIKKWFNKDRKFIFVLTMICGIITHFLLLANLILSQDGLLNGIHYTAGGYEASLGRWGINFFDSLRNNIAFPFITTLISIILMGFINILIIELFEIKSKVFKAITAISFVVAPSLCMTLLYAYTADAYFYAMFLAVFCVYALYKMQNKKLGIVLSALSFILVMATYQSYLGVVIGLVFMMSIKKLCDGKNTSFEVFKDLVKNAIILILSGIVYFIITKIILAVNDLTMSTYQGLNEISVISILGSMALSVKNAYIGFLKYFFADGIILNRIWNREKLYLIFFLLYSVSMIVVFINMWKKEDNKKERIVRTAFVILLTILLPVALNLVVILAPGSEIYYLTATQMVFMLPFVFMILELLSEKSFLTVLINWLVVIVSTIIVITYFLSIVVTYQTLELSYNQAKSVANRVINRMEEYPGYRSGMKTVLAGVIDDQNFPKTLDIYNYALTNSLRTSILHSTYWGQKATWENFIELFCGVSINFCEDYEYYNIIHSEEFEQMDIFPGENSVKIIDDIMVIKFCENPDNPPPSQNLADHGINL